MNERRIKAALQSLDTLPMPEKEEILAPCQAIPLPDSQPGRRFRLRPMLVAAVVVILLVSLSVYAVAAEAKEYRQAVTFFEEHDLPTDGLSRAEIKEVYRDISTGTFSSEKTLQVLQIVGGYELVQNTPGASQVVLEDLWNLHNSTANAPEYSLDNTDVYEGAPAALVCTRPDGTSWRAEFEGLGLDGYVPCERGVLVWGNNITTDTVTTTFAFLALVDTDGTICWQTSHYNQFGWELIEAVIPEENSIAVFGRGDFETLIFSRYDYEGRRLHYQETVMEQVNGIRAATQLGEDYLLRMQGMERGSWLARLDSLGNLTEGLFYSANEETYCIVDMLEYGGKVYLSTYAYPTPDGGLYSQHSELDLVHDVVWARDACDFPSDELTRLVRENYTAVLLVCDPDSGTPEEFYSAEGSLGGSLSLTADGQLLWQTESIEDTVYSPATSAFSIAGACRIYEYTFNSAGALLHQEKTEQFTDFRR